MCYVWKNYTSRNTLSANTPQHKIFSLQILAHLTIRIKYLHNMSAWLFPFNDVSSPRVFIMIEVLVGSRRGARVLCDEDSTSVVVKSRKRLNTLSHYQVTDGASLALQARPLYANSVKNGTFKQRNGMITIILTIIKRRSNMASHGKCASYSSQR